jgi:hypothetical protein
VPPVAAVGPLDAETLAGLRQAVEGILSVPVDGTPYERLFEWRARNLPGHLMLYRQFVAAVDQTAHQRAQRPFATAPPETRRAIVREIGRFGTRAQPPIKLWRGLAHRRLVLYANEVIRPVLTLFAQTHAIELAGFGPWPGTPRGLVGYRAWPHGARERSS